LTWWRRYNVRVPMDVYPALDESARDDGSVPAVQRLHANVMSEGTTGALVFNPPAIDFGCALVGSVTRVPLMLENK
jgi:hypothetical protein